MAECSRCRGGHTSSGERYSYPLDARGTSSVQSGTLNRCTAARLPSISAIPHFGQHYPSDRSGARYQTRLAGERGICRSTGHLSRAEAALGSRVSGVHRAVDRAPGSARRLWYAVGDPGDDDARVGGVGVPRSLRRREHISGRVGDGCYCRAGQSLAASQRRLWTLLERLLRIAIPPGPCPAGVVAGWRPACRDDYSRGSRGVTFADRVLALPAPASIANGRRGKLGRIVRSRGGHEAESSGRRSRRTRERFRMRSGRFVALSIGRLLS